MLDAAEEDERLRAGNGATVQRIPDDGNCIPRAALTAAGRSSGARDVARLRSEVLAAMAGDRKRCAQLLPQLQGGLVHDFRGSCIKKTCFTLLVAYSRSRTQVPLMSGHPCLGEANRLMNCIVLCGLGTSPGCGRGRRRRVPRRRGRPRGRSRACSTATCCA